LVDALQKMPVLGYFLVICVPEKNSDTVKWTECQGKSIDGAKLVKIKHFNPYGEANVTEQYIYFGENEM
jgi:hypothetical protein